MPDTDSNPRSFDQRFEADGLDLVSSLDEGRPPRYPILINVRQIQRGQFRSRPALNALSTAPAGKTPWHSCRRLNDKPSGNYALIAGIGAELFATPAAAAAAAPGNPVSKDSGYSGNPLSLIPFQPENDVAEWMAAIDINKMRKIRLDGTVHQLGLPQPTKPPDIGLDWQFGMQRLDIDTGDSAAGWANSAPGAIVATVLTRTNAQCTVVRSLWGDGPDPTLGLVAGWQSIEVAVGPPSGLIGIGPGSILKDSAGAPKQFSVEELHPQTPAITTINQILLDPDGTNQWAVLVPVAAYNEFQQHCIIHAVHGGVDHYGVITAVTKGPDNTIAIRAYFNTSVAALAAGDNVETRPTIYAYSPTGSFPTGAMTSKGVKYAGLNTPSVIYNLDKTGLALNLSAFGTSGKQVDTSQDEMHCSLFATDWTQVDAIQLQMDADDGTFTKNYFTHVVRQADLLALQANALSAIDTRDQQNRNAQINDPKNQLAYITNPKLRGGGLLQSTPGQPIYPPYTGPPPGGPDTDPAGGSSSQGTTGASQWAEIRFKLSDLAANRFGNDLSKGLQSIVAIRVAVTRNALANGLDVSFGSWWIGGGSAPDITTGAPYEYRYRYRSLTGARSNWSPPGRSLAWPHRYSVYVQFYFSNFVGNPAAPTEATRIDIQRRGGTVNQWVAVASVDNPGGASGTWLDAYDDLYALGASEDPLSLEGNINDQPFTVQQAAFTDTVTTVSGTLIKHTGAFAAFMSGTTSILQPGTGVIVNGVSTLVQRLMSADILEVYDNVGAGINMKLEMPSPFLVGRPLPVAFEIADGWFGGCGDPKNPGRLYVFNKGTLDSAPGNYVVDITDPGDPLQNGCNYLGRGYLWSGNSMFVLTIDPSLPGAPVRFERLMSAVGMFARYALCVGDAMYWLGKDGIYTSEGGPAHNITVGILAPLFPTKQSDGQDIKDPVNPATTLIFAPAMTVANAVADGTATHQFRLSYHYDKTLWFDYVDGTATRRSLGLMRAAGIGMMVATGSQEQWGWWYDSYANGVLFHYSAEGENIRQILCGGTTNPAKLYSMGPSVNGDDGTAIACRVRSFAFDADYPRSKKLWSDGLLDADPGGGSLAIQLLFDNQSTAFVPSASPLVGAGRPNVPTPLDINSGRGQYSRNMAIDITWTVTAVENPILYRWGGSVIVRPDETIKRSTDFTDCGFWGPKEFRGADIECMSAAFDGAGSAIATAKTLVFEYTKDDGTVATTAVNVFVNEKSIVPVAFPATFIGYEIRIRPSDANTWKQFEVKQWHFDQLADLTALITPWEDLGEQSYVQGIELYADSNGVPIVVNVQKDFAVLATPFTVNHPGRGWKSYSFAAPFLAFLLRLVPQGAVRLMKWRWDKNPEAVLGDVWEAQEIEMGDPFGLAQYAEVEYASTSTVTLKYTIDGTFVYTDAATLVSTGAVDPGTFVKKRVVLPAVKGRLAKIRFESASQFRIREKGTGIYRKSYGGGEGFRFAALIGGTHRQNGARV